MVSQRRKLELKFGRERVLSEKSDEHVNLQKIVILLEEIAKWVKAASRPSVRDVLQEQLKKPEDRAAYHNSDGQKTSREVG